MCLFSETTALQEADWVVLSPATVYEVAEAGHGSTNQKAGWHGHHGPRGRATKRPRSRRWASRRTQPRRGPLRAESGGVSGSFHGRFGFQAESGGISGSSLGRFRFPAARTVRSQSGVGDHNALMGPAGASPPSAFSSQACLFAELPLLAELALETPAATTCTRSGPADHLGQKPVFVVGS